MKAMLMTLTLTLTALIIAGCNPGTANKEKIYDVKGKVVTVDLEKKKVTLDHEAIPGHMNPMTMPFDVEDAKLLDGLKAGDQVQGKLKVQEGKNDVITELKKQ
jgi:protein SCO1